MKTKRNELDRTQTLPYQYTADNEEMAVRIAQYLVTTLGHLDDEVTTDGERVLYKHVPVGRNADRLVGYIDGLRDGLVGVA